MNTLFSDRISALRHLIAFQDQLHVVDVGANPMKHETPYKLLHMNGDLAVIGFDPQAETLASLQHDDRTRDQFLPHAIGDGESHQLNIYHGSGLTSLLKIRRKTLFYLMGLKRAARLVDTATFDTKRLDDLDDIQRMDLLKIDVQGAETMVFENGHSKLESTLAVHTEVNFFPLYENQPSFGEVDVSLRQAGFVPHSYYHTVTRQVRSSFTKHVQNLPRTHLLDGDMIYFRDLSDAATLSDEDLRKLALISDGIYGFYDYTLRCVDELKRRGMVENRAVENYLRLLNDTLLSN